MGDYLFDQYRKRLEATAAKLDELIQKADELKASLVEMRDEINYTLSPKKEEEIEAEFNPIRDDEETETMDEVVEEAPVQEAPAMVDPNLADPAALDLGIETPAEEPKTQGVANIKAAFEEYPSVDEIKVVNPAQMPIEEKPKRTMFNRPMDDISKIDIQIVNPAAPAQQAPVQEQPAPVMPQAPQIPSETSEQFTDEENQNPTKAQ